MHTVKIHFLGSIYLGHAFSPSLLLPLNWGVPTGAMTLLTINYGLVDGLFLKIIFYYSHIHFFMHWLWCFCATTKSWSCNRHFVDCKGKLFIIWPYKKRFAQLWFTPFTSKCKDGYAWFKSVLLLSHMYPLFLVSSLLLSFEWVKVFFFITSPLFPFSAW